MTEPRVLICNTQVPFAGGGAELLVTSLEHELLERGYKVETIEVPFSWRPRTQLLKSALAWRMLDVSTSPAGPVDLVIATRFPSYLIKHPNKVVWLVHQFRQVYDLDGTRFSDFSESAEDRALVETIHGLDRRALGEARALFTISRNTAARLERYLSLGSETLYPPPPIAGLLRTGDYGDYVLGVGRMDALKRFELMLTALAATRSAVRGIIAGSGPDEERLRARARDLGLGDRVEFLGRVSDERLADLYAEALAVFYAPFDEDYGYVTVESFLAAKPVLTASDSGGVLEFVEDEVNGYVVTPEDSRTMGERIDRLWNDRAIAARLGRMGRELAARIRWDQVVDRLTATL